MTWRPYEPHKPDFKFRPQPETLSDMLEGLSVLEVLADDEFVIGKLYSTGPFNYYLSKALAKSYSLEKASERLWERFKAKGGEA